MPGFPEVEPEDEVLPLMLKLVPLANWPEVCATAVNDELLPGVANSVFVLQLVQMRTTNTANNMLILDVFIRGTIIWLN